MRAVALQAANGLCNTSIYLTIRLLTRLIHSKYTPTTLSSIICRFQYDTSDDLPVLLNTSTEVWDNNSECNITSSRVVENKTMIANCKVIVNNSANLSMYNVTYQVNQSADNQYPIDVLADGIGYFRNVTFTYTGSLICFRHHFPRQRLHRERYVGRRFKDSVDSQWAMRIPLTVNLYKGATWTYPTSESFTHSSHSSTTYINSSPAAKLLRIFVIFL